MSASIEQQAAQPADPAFDFFEFANLPVAEIFTKLVWVCDGHLAEATVLYDLVLFYKANQDLNEWRTKSSRELGREYGQEGNGIQMNRAISDLTLEELIEQKPVVRNMPRKYKLDWVALSHLIVELDEKLPGMKLPYGY